MKLRAAARATRLDATFAGRVSTAFMPHTPKEH
jgi:hypothetical protein